MASSAGNIVYDVDCGVNQMEKKCVKLMYEVDDPLLSIRFEWIHLKKEDGSLEHVAHLIALESKRGHKSKPIPDDTYKKLGKPHMERKEEFCQVLMSRAGEVNIGTYFGKSCR